MFSDITNQVFSWMGSVKTEDEENVSSPNISNEKEPISSKELEIFSNVKNQIEGIGDWLGSNIPKFSLTEKQECTEQLTITESVEPQAAETHSPKDEDDSKNCNHVTGDDSERQSTASFSEDTVNQLDTMAKSLGNFFNFAVNKVGRTISDASVIIKESIENYGMLEEFNKEQEEFIKTKNNVVPKAILPWTGCANEEALKEECLSLSKNRRIFLRSPPIGVEFQFDYQITYPVAMAIMEEDPDLERMRYELVPKVITEQNFWRNYFYRLSLILQANECKNDTYTSDELGDSSKEDVHEFVSDILQTSSEDLNEVREGMKTLTFSSGNNEKEWERELQVELELQEYEMVIEQKSINSRSDIWEQELEELEELLQDDTNE